MDIKKDDIVLISTGEYSDYSILSTFVANEFFNTRNKIIEYLVEFPKAEEALDEDLFMKWLFSKKLIKELKTKEWQLTKYGRFNI